MKRIFFIMFVLLPVFGVIDARSEPITDVDVVFDLPQKEALKRSAKNYLSRYLGKAATKKESDAAEAFFNSTYFSSSSSCRYVHDVGTRLLCEIKSKRTVRHITIANLPAALLERDLKRKLPLQVGYAVALDQSFFDTLSTVKARVQTFLRKNGFYGAEIAVGHKADAASVFVDITVDIKGGFFARVNNVTVDGNPPMNPRAVRNHYRRMCFSFNSLIESISIGTLSCYSRERERETTQALLDRFAKLGYIQSRIRVSHQWIDPKSEQARGECREEGKGGVSRCVNLRVTVERGPKVRWTVSIKDGVAINRNAVERFIGSIFSVERFSRASVSRESDEVALDQVIIEEELLDQITFVSSKNVDEQELRESAHQITEFLIAKGYPNAEVVPTFIQEDDDNILVNFDIFPGDSHFVTEVAIAPEKYQRFFREEELANLIPERSFTETGYLSKEKVQAAVETISNRLKERGFTNVAIKPDIISSSAGFVRITFYVTSDERRLVDEILILNGHENLNREILPSLNNCDSYKVNDEERSARKLCHESSFVADKVEEDAARLVDFYTNNAFFYTRVKSEVVKSELGNRIIFTLYDKRFESSNLKPLVRQEIKDIWISGNNATNTQVIKRLFPKPRKSNELDPVSLKKGLAKMREQGRFSRIDQTVMQGQQNSDDLYFLVHVAERPSLTLDAAFGFSTDQLFSAELELEETNLFWSMLRLNTSLNLGLFWGRQSIFSNKLIWPFVLGLPLRISITAPMIIYEDLMHRKMPSRVLRSKVSFALEWHATSFITPYVRYDLALLQEQKFTSAEIVSASQRLATLDGLVSVMRTEGDFRGVLKPGISYINLDNPFDPRKGIDSNLWVEFSGGPLIGDPPYANVGIQNRFYVPVGPLTLAFQASFMRAFIHPSESNWKKLRNSSSMDALGGDRSVRGYREGYILVDSTTMETSSYAGYFSMNTNMEVRFPITTKSSIGNFSGAVFFDQGMVIPCTEFLKCVDVLSGDSLMARGLGISLGVALRYSLPVGPVSLDYGVSPLTGDARVHLLFGYAF